jgi:proteasome assembly chaperone (PAC2) family protein
MSHASRSASNFVSVSYTRREVELPNRPVLIVGLEGWVDAGSAAAGAISAILDQCETRTYAVFDSDELIDQRARRPSVRRSDGVRGRIFWPGPRLRVGTDARGNGVAVLVGSEPDLRWRPFATEVAELAVELGATLVVGFGAVPVQTPHTRSIPVMATASDQALARRIGFRSGSRERPARISDIVGVFCADAGIPSIDLVVRVPHYVSSMPFPAASIALVEALSRVSGISVDTEDLEREAEVTRTQVDELIAQSSEHTAMVRQLEEEYEEEDSGIVTDRDIPSGDEIAAELERFLRGETP